MRSALDNTVLAPRRISAPVHVTRVLRGFRRRNILLVFSVFVLLTIVATGISAPWISPHNPTRGELKNQKLPPAWIGERTTTKTVVDFGQSPDQISISKAKRINRDIELGDQIEVVIRGAGSTKFLLGTDHLGRDMLSRIIHGARISLIITAITLGVGGFIGTSLGLAAGSSDPAADFHGSNFGQLGNRVNRRRGGVCLARYWTAGIRRAAAVRLCFITGNSDLFHLDVRGYLPGGRHTLRLSGSQDPLRIGNGEECFG